MSVCVYMCVHTYKYACISIYPHTYGYVTHAYRNEYMCMYLCVYEYTSLSHSLSPHFIYVCVWGGVCVLGNDNHSGNQSCVFVYLLPPSLYLSLTQSLSLSLSSLSIYLSLYIYIYIYNPHLTNRYVTIRLNFLSLLL